MSPLLNGMVASMRTRSCFATRGQCAGEPHCLARNSRCRSAVMDMCFEVGLRPASARSGDSQVTRHKPYVPSRALQRRRERASAGRAARQHTVDGADCPRKYCNQAPCPCVQIAAQCKRRFFLGTSVSMHKVPGSSPRSHSKEEHLNSR